MKKAAYVPIVLSAICALTLGACAAPAPAPVAPPAATSAPAPATAAPAAAKPTSYILGFVDHLTGDGAPYGNAQKQGTELAVDVINAKGGINGVPLEVVYEDDRMVAADAQTALFKLVQTDKVPVVFGSASSTVSLSICPKVQELKVVQFTISTSPELRNCGSFTFGSMASDSAQGPEWAKVAQYLKADEVALLYINNDYGIGVKDAFTDAFQKAGGKLLIAQSFAVGSKDFRSEILKVKATNPKVVFIVSHMAEGSILIKQAKELGMTAQWVTDVALVSKEFPQLAGAASEGVMGLNAGAPSGAEYQAYAEAFKKKFNTEPTLWSEYGYDMVMIVAKAMQKAGYDADAIRQALPAAASDYVGPSGAKKFDQYNISMGTYEWMVVKDGAWVMSQK